MRRGDWVLINAPFMDLEPREGFMDVEELVKRCEISCEPLDHCSDLLSD